jgi:hypothetical protein
MCDKQSVEQYACVAAWKLAHVKHLSLNVQSSARSTAAYKVNKAVRVQDLLEPV